MQTENKTKIASCVVIYTRPKIFNYLYYALDIEQQFNYNLIKY